ncbi:insulinase family protein [Luteimonas sp. Sa2BVA3]|uniref:Insulinase family protein n=1 Tax=Luteimonas colneyensis TaxID=2762230 RepID=A0ABR8UL89_9GAMM|nr:pitrilysin family protein [Luteimonas colneyensis]MBD7988772.1 insulinase family protein [Luteimonas colneyensis]
MTRFFKHSLLALAVSALATGAALAGPGADLPKDLPPYAADKPLPVPDIARKTLANGLEVWVVPRDGIPRVDYVLAVRNAGYVADAADAPGFASLLAGLLAEGTAQRDSRQIAEFAQAQGGSVGASVSSDGALVYGNALAANAGPMLSLLAEVARTPSFPEGEVKLAQANALQALKAAEAQPGFRANRALLSAVYGDHPYARTQQTEASIMAVTPEVLRSEHARRFHPDRALLVVAGRIDADEAFRFAEQAFGDWTASGAEVPPTPAARTEAAPQRLLLQRDGSVQSTLRLASPAVAATHPDAIPLQLAGTVLGGSFSSRVMQNLREEKGYTYGARAGATSSARGGYVSGAADVRNEVTGASLTEFFSEYRRIGTEPVPTAELDDTKRYVAGGYLISNQMQAAVAATLAGNWLVGLPPEYLGEFVPKVRAVDAGQVQAMAAKYFAPERQSIIVVGDGAAVSGQLAEWGEFTTID